MAIIVSLGRNLKPTIPQPDDTALNFLVLEAAPQATALAASELPAQIVDPINHEYYGTAGPDTFTAPTGDNWYLSGQGGNDSLSGGSGNDTIAGGPGSDIMAG